MEGGLDPMGEWTLTENKFGKGLKDSGNDPRLKLGVYKLHEDSVVPEYATEGSAAFDLRAYLKSDMTIKVNGEKRFLHADFIELYPGDIALIPTGLIFDIPDNTVLKLFARSSLPLKKGLNLGNSVAIIDSDYVNETFIMIHNFSSSTVTIEHGERIAQGILEVVAPVNIQAIDERPEQKTDRQGGMGSTGSK